MNKFWIILSHTYMSRVKAKSFLITTLVSLVLIFAISNIQTFIEAFSDDGNGKIAVIDETGELFEPLQKGVEDADEGIKLVAFEGSESEGKKAVQNEDYQALVSLSSNENQLPEASYYANTITDSEKQTTIEEQLQQLKISIATQQAGIDQAQLAEIYAPVGFHTVSLDKSAKTDEELSQARGIVYVMLFLLYMTVLMYGQMIAQDVATEKSSRVMELLVSSVSPITQMFAKIIGIALVGITQLVVILGAGYIMVTSKQSDMTGEVFNYFGIKGASLSLFVYAVVFFLLGYLLYATLAAMLGSLVSRTEDVQQLMMPMMFLVIAAFMIAMFGLNAPESSFVKISSYIPFFSPMLMFLRVGMVDVPIWEVALSIGILMVTIVLLAIIGARIYKGGVLMYGNSGSLKDLGKALKLSKKE
ncbi:ABC transporter permease [Lentibacillus sp. N15]|uniref:ABC transporter permease n=1 Tax=Lentibacillus songyuanensis TaxID=3136161 RepID=UPI0031BA5520